MSEPITPLWVRSGYSLQRGTAPPSALVEAARRAGHDRLALTDVNNLYGLTSFWTLARQAGLSPIVGAQLSEAGQDVSALVADPRGYENLCRLISRIRQADDGRAVRPAQADETAPAEAPSRGPEAFRLIARRPRPPRRPGQLIDDLRELSAGLELIVQDPHLAAALVRAGLNGEHLWLGIDPAVQPYGRLLALRRAAGELSLNLVAMGQALMLEAADLELARLLSAIRAGTTFDTAPVRELPSPKALLRGPDQLARELSEWPGAARNNRVLADRCAALQLLPRRPVFPDFALPAGLSAPAYLRQLCREGMIRRYGRVTEQAQARLEHELSLIVSKGFSEYFLVVWDIVQYARRRGAPVAGRGSGASSLAAYLLGITNICPLRYSIPFERFLNGQREDFPDLDVDFCWRIRDEVIEYVFNRWGADHVAMVCTHNCFQERSALREAAKALGYSNAQVSAGDAEQADPRLGRLGSLARRLVGLPNHLSVHPGGVVIGKKPIDHYVPIEPAPKGVMIAQLDKDGIEQIGLVKLDLLGNRNLSTVRCASELIRRRTGRLIDVEALDDADPDTVRILRSAQTVGCNQLESPAMRHLLAAMAPTGVADVMKALALIRPGAAGIGMKEAFIRRQRGLEAPPPQPEVIQRLLGHSHGVMLYEDDVMLVAAAMTGRTIDQADRFRKAIQKCRDDAERLALSREFLSACRANGFDGEYAKAMWVQMAKFNAYSFCRAHAGSYAILAYAGAYLKAHWPLEFWTSALNNNQSLYPLRVYVEQAKRAGVRFALPDVNRSEAEFRIDANGDGEAIRVGLSRIAGLGPVGVEAILRARAEQPFTSLSDLLVRTGLSREQARGLVLCGAMDSLGRRRPVLMMELNLFFTIPSSARLVGGRTLLSSPPVLPDPPGDYPPQRKFTDQWRLLGLSVGEHILSGCRAALEGFTDARSGDLPGRVGRSVRLAGMLEAARVTQTSRDESMMFLTLDDEDGLFEATVFPDVCRALRGRMQDYGPYIVSGMVEDQYGSLTVSTRNIQPLAAPLPESAAG
jgi:DNA polymerase III alpha subunit